MKRNRPFRTALCCFLAALLILATLPAFMLISSAQSYSLYICYDTVMTDDNRGDILGDGVFSYDPSSKTLTVNGNCSTDKGYVIDSEINGLTIRVASDSVLEATRTDAIRVENNTTITGSGKLTLIGEQAGLSLGAPREGGSRDYTLTVKDTTLVSQARMAIIADSTNHEKLVIDNARVSAHGTEYAFCFFGSEPTLTNCAIVDFSDVLIEDCAILQPEGASISNGSVKDANGRDAKTLTIGV